MAAVVRSLTEADGPALDDFFRRHPHTTLFLQSNRAVAGLEDRGERFQGAWAGAFRDGALRAVAAHFWNGVVILECPEALEAVLDAAVAASRRAVDGLIGPAEQVALARRHLGLAHATPRLASDEDLFVLALADLRVPEPLRGGAVRLRAPTEAERPLLVDWRRAYAIEVLGARDEPSLPGRCAEEIDQLLALERIWLLESGGRPVATTALNAALPHCVQVGGVYTPPAFRGRGHARAAVAGSLLEARARGAGEAVLFTGRDNAMARRVYDALGFRARLAWALLLLR